MSIGSLIVKIGADITGIRRDAKRGAESLGSLERGARTLGTALKVMAVGVVAKELASMVRGAMDAIDASAKLSRQLGGTINGLQGLQLAATEAGVSTSGLTTASEMLNRRLGEAARKGSGEAYEALKRLGFQANQLAAMDTDERIAALADAFREQGYTAQQTADTLARLGIRQAEFTRLVMDGGEPIRAARGAIEDMGLALSEVDAAKVEAANDAMNRAKLASTAIAQRLAIELSPVITAISNQFIDAAKDTQGLKETVDDVVKAGVLGMGYLGDGIKGVVLVFKAVEVAAWAVAEGATEAYAWILKSTTKLVDGAITEINKLIASLNMIPGVDIMPLALTSDSVFMEALEDFRRGVSETAGAVREQIEEMATSEWPSDKAQRFYAEIQAAAETAAQATVNARREALNFGGVGDESDEAQQAAAEKLREQLQSQLDALREHAMTAEELEQAHHARRLEQLNAALDAQLVTQSEFASLSENLEARHMEALEQIRKRGMDRVKDVSVESMLSGVRQITSMLASLTASAASENKAMFDAHKAFAIADAVISGAAGVAQTMGAYPFPWNIPFAAAHAVMAAAQVAMIASQQFQGGSRTVRSPAAPSVPSSSRGAGAGGGYAGAGAGGGVTGGQSQLLQINLQGDTFSRNTVLSLIEGINDAVADGARIVVA